MKKLLIAAAAIIGLTLATTSNAWEGSAGVGYPTVVAPQAVYIQPQPVYVQPQPVYVAPQRPVYVAQPDYTPAIIAAGVILGGAALLSSNNGNRGYYAGRGPGHYKGYAHGYRKFNRGNDHKRGGRDRH